MGKKSRFIPNPCITQNKLQIDQRFKKENTLLLLSHIQLFAIPWTVACQSPLFMRFSRQEYWSGLPFLPLGNLPNPGIQLVSCIHSDTYVHICILCAHTISLVYAKQQVLLVAFERSTLYYLYYQCHK